MCRPLVAVARGGCYVSALVAGAHRGAVICVSLDGCYVSALVAVARWGCYVSASVAGAHRGAVMCRPWWLLCVSLGGWSP